MFQILVTLSFQEPGNPRMDMNTVVLQFRTQLEANVAFDKIAEYYPKSAIYANAVKLY